MLKAEVLLVYHAAGCVCSYVSMYVRKKDTN